MRFEDIKFKPHDLDPDGLQALIDFGKYDLSVIRFFGSYGSKNGLYEIAVMDADTHDFVSLPGLTQEDGVKGFLTEHKITEIMFKLAAITDYKPKQVM